MSDADEIRALTEELERLAKEAEIGSTGPDASANKARQTEIRAWLVALGRPIG